MAIRAALFLALVVRDLSAFSLTAAGHPLRLYLERHRVKTFITADIAVARRYARNARER